MIDNLKLKLKILTTITELDQDIICNGQIGSSLMDMYEFESVPIHQNLNIEQTPSVMIGLIGENKVKINPNMKWDDFSIFDWNGNKIYDFTELIGDNSLL